MESIIEQLEEGKKNQEEQGIDIDSLRTKLNDTNDDVPKEKPKRKTKEKKLEDPFEQAEKLEQESQKESNYERPMTPLEQKAIAKEKVERYPGYDYTNFYEVGQTIYFIRVLKPLGVKELLTLKIRACTPTYITGSQEKGSCYLLGRDVSDMIYTDYKQAKKAFKDIEVIKPVYEKDDLGDVTLEDVDSDITEEGNNE